MSSQTQLSCCNLSLLSIGARAQVSSINPSDGSAAGDACSQLFSFVFEQLARTTKWSCLGKQVSLTLIQAAQGTPENPNGTTLPLPQQPYLYGYLYPTDCILMKQIFPPVVSSGSAVGQTSLSNSVAPIIPGQDEIPYEIGYTVDANNNPLQVILTNQENAVADYNVNQQNPQSWDSLFTSAFIASLAVYLVPALSLNPPLMQAQMAIAERLINQAQGQDANENPSTQDVTPDWIQARSGATGYTSRYGYNAYGVMQWPV